MHTALFAPHVESFNAALKDGLKLHAYSPESLRHAEWDLTGISDKFWADTPAPETGFTYFYMNNDRVIVND